MTDYQRISNENARMAEILQAAREGRLVALPCKVGDEMWFIAWKDVMHGRCRNISIHSGGMQITFDDDAGKPWTVGIKRVFDSRAKAEKAMEVTDDA